MRFGRQESVAWLWYYCMFVVWLYHNHSNIILLTVFAVKRKNRRGIDDEKKKCIRSKNVVMLIENIYKKIKKY